MNEKWSIGDGKNNAEWCVFKGGVCVASCSTEHGIFISEAQNIATKMNEIESMRQQLAAAIAACKLKDEELEKIRGHIGLYNLFSCVGSDSYDPECADLNVGKCREIATKALAIRPGTEALEKWLGEPVAIIGKHGHPKHVSAIPSIEENRLYGPFEPLYAKPKGLK